MTSGRPGRSRGEAGQAAVEFALALPVVVVAMIAVAQVGVIVRDDVAVVHAARAGARAASVAADPAGAAARAATAATRLPVTVTTSVHAGAVTVTVTYRDDTDAPFIGALFPPVIHRASATMPLEPP